MTRPRFSGRLIVWQLADQLRIDVFKLTKSDRLEFDRRLRLQIEDAASEVCRNIVEAFATSRDREFARFVRLARSAIGDLQNSIRIALMKRYLGEADLREVREVVSRLYPALTALLSDTSAPAAPEKVLEPTGNSR